MRIGHEEHGIMAVLDLIQTALRPPASFTARQQDVK